MSFPKRKVIIGGPQRGNMSRIEGTYSKEDAKIKISLSLGPNLNEELPLQIYHYFSLQNYQAII